MIKSIATPRLCLRPIHSKDALTFFEAEQASINELSPYWSWVHPNKTLTEIKEFINSSHQCHQDKSPTQIFYSILDKNKKFVGLIWFQSINWFVPRFEISYWLDTRETGKGYMTEAVNALTRASFQVYGAKRIEIKIFENNKKSKRVPEKLGFTLEGEMKNYFINLITKDVMNGLLYACRNPNSLPTLTMDIY